MMEHLLNPKQLAEILNVKPGTVYSWLSRGVDIPHVKIAGTVRFREKAVMKEFVGLLHVEGIAKYLGVSARTIHRLLKSGELPGCKVGRQWRFEKQAVDEWLKWRRK